MPIGPPYRLGHRALLVATATALAASVTGSTLAAQGAGPSMQRSLELPTVDILYPPGGSLLDRLCKTDFKLAVDDAAVQAAVKNRDAFQRQWDTDGPVYLTTALAAAGRSFPYREMQALDGVLTGVDEHSLGHRRQTVSANGCEACARLGIRRDRLSRANAYLRKSRLERIGLDAQVRH
jgi:hypothetical protein